LSISFFLQSFAFFLSLSLYQLKGLEALRGLNALLGSLHAAAAAALETSSPSTSPLRLGPFAPLAALPYPFPGSGHLSGNRQLRALATAWAAAAAALDQSSSSRAAGIAGSAGSAGGTFSGVRLPAGEVTGASALAAFRTASAHLAAHLAAHADRDAPCSAGGAGTGVVLIGGGGVGSLETLVGACLGLL